MTSSLDPRPPRSAVLGDEVYERLGAAILDGSLPEGHHLRDHELAERLGVSRTPVREALQRLERAGLVEVAPNRYTRVSKMSPKLYDDTLEFVVFFMGNVLRIAIERSDDDALGQIVARADAMTDASRAADAAAMLDATAEFLDFITDATGNVVFMKVLHEAQIALRRNLAHWHPFIECPIARTEGYVQLRAAIGARAAVAAEVKIRELNGFS